MAKISISELNPATPNFRELSEGELKITGGGKDEYDGGSSQLRHVYDDKKGKKK
ncbi:MAG: hypothetical protein ACRC2R_10000 [Xenococcaceae cyanobacterium]